MRRDSTSGRQRDRVPGALQRDPFVDQRAGIGAGDAGFGGAQMAQPAEAQQRRSPIRPMAAPSRTPSGRRRSRPCRRRRNGRNRFRSHGLRRRCADPAARSAGGRSGCGSSGQRSSGWPLTRPATRRSPAAQATSHGQLGMVRDRYARHRRACPSVERGCPCPAGGHHSETVSRGQQRGQRTVISYAFCRASRRKSRRGRRAADRHSGKWQGRVRRSPSGSDEFGEAAHLVRGDRPPPHAGSRASRPAIDASPSSGSSEQVQ